jgi:hypothetical protein
VSLWPKAQELEERSGNVVENKEQLKDTQQLCRQAGLVQTGVPFGREGLPPTVRLQVARPTAAG